MTFLRKKKPPHPRLTRDAIRLPVAPAAAGRAFGLPRSGNHAIIAWALRNVSQPHHVFCNNCVPGRDPLASFTQLEIDGTGRTGLANAGNADGVLGKLTAPPFLMVSYERWDGDLAEAEGAISDGMPSDRFDWQILIYRSFLNWLASTLALRRRQAEERGHRPQAALRQTRTAMSAYPAMLRLTREKGPLTPVLYDRWFVDQAYRAELLTTLGLEVRDTSLGPMTKMGGGSSFETDGGNVARLNVTDRWRDMLANDAEYRALVAEAAVLPGLVDELDAAFPDDAEVIVDTARAVA